MWASLEPYVTFGFDPFKRPRTEKGKRQYKRERERVRDYWQAFRALTSRQYKVYRPRKPENLKPAQEAAQHPPGFDRFAVAFLPAPPDARVRVSKGKARVTSKHVTRITYLFSQFEKKKGERLTNPAAIARRILKADKKRSKSFVAMAGEHETSKWIKPTLAALTELIEYHATNYGNQAKWFWGVIGYSYTKQADASAYRAAKTLSPKVRRQRRKAWLKRNDPKRANER